MKSKYQFMQKIYKYYYIQKHKISFLLGYLSFGAKVSLIGITISFVSLFLPWAASFDGIIQSSSINFVSFSSFSSTLGNVGFLISFILLVSSFFLLSLRGKQKIRFLFHFQSSSSHFCFWASIFIFILCIQTYFFIGGLQVFSATIIYEKGIILGFTGTLIFLIGSGIMLQEISKNSVGSYIHESEKIYHIPEYDKKKNNMKLPF